MDQYNVSVDLSVGFAVTPLDRSMTSLGRELPVGIRGRMTGVDSFRDAR